MVTEGFQMNNIGVHYGYWSKEWDTDIIALVKRVSKLGLNILEMNPPKYMMELDKVKMKELKTVAEAHNVELTICIGFPKEMDMSSEDAGVRQAGIEYTKRMLEAVHFMGGTILSGILYSYWPATYEGILEQGTKEAYLERGLESVNQVIGIAEDYNIMYAIELVNRFEQFMLNSVGEGLDFVKKVNRPNCKLLLDTFHLNIEEDDVAEAIRQAGPYLGHMHVCENNRKVPGKGNHIDWPAVFRVLKDIEYNGRIVMEPFVQSGGPVGRDLRIWRDLSGGADQQKLDQDLTEGLQFLKQQIGTTG
jgi:D-psicose/D-tagatose/L-ribulose 3-epimerase